MDKYLESAFFINSDHPDVIRYAKETVEDETDSLKNVLKLYYRIRDDFKYFPYNIDLNPDALRASELLKKNKGYCIEKANLLAATCRSIGVPARLGFAIVTNHIGTANLEKILKTSKLVFHGYTEVFLDDKWVKATPAFDAALCNRLGVQPLEFDGKNDSIFHEYDSSGGRFMEYEHDYGTFSDIPYDLMIAEFKKYYPHLFEDFMKKQDERKYKRVFFYSGDAPL